MKRTLSLVLALTMAFSLSFGAVAESADPIRIGVLCTQDGASGLGAHAAVDLFFKEHGLNIAGRTVEIYHENTASDPAIAIEKLVKCVDEYGCQIIIGPLSGSEGTAVKEYAEFYLDDVTILVGSSGSTQITLNTPANLFRICATAAQVGVALGQYCYEQLGMRNVLCVASDYDFTFGQVQGFMYGFVGAGGNIVDKIWFTKGTTDYSSVIASITKYDNLDAIFCGIGASDSMYFVQQYHDYGLKYQLLGGSNFTDVSCLISDIGSYYEGILCSSYWADDLGTPNYDAFVKSYTDFYGSAPSSFASDFYMAAQIVTNVLETMDGKVEDQELLRSRLAEYSYDSPRGQFRFDADHQYICDVFITEVQNTENGYKNIAIKTIEDVTQYGPFDPEWFAAQPDPDRENPSVDAIKNAVYAK